MAVDFYSREQYLVLTYCPVFVLYLNTAGSIEQEHSGFNSAWYSMKIKSTIEDSIAILEIEGSLSSDTKIEFDAEIHRYAGRSVHVILDLSKVAFVDSSTLGSIIKFYGIFKKNGRHLLLSGINQKIYDVFRLTGISKQINVFESARDAVEFIGMNG